MVERQLRPRPAFTIIELTIVLLVMGILSAVAAPRYIASITHFRAEAAVRAVAADLEWARRQAWSKGSNMTVQFSMEENAYTITGLVDIDHPAQTYRCDLARTGYPATLSAASFNNTAAITFDLHGQPWAGTPPAALSSGSVVLQVGNQQRTIQVDTATGRTRIL